MKINLLALVATTALGMASPALAGVVFDNPFNGLDGNCLFNTTCGPQAGPGANVFAGQRFTLTEATTLTGGTFTAYTNSTTQPTSANWLLLAADGSGGLPGTLLSSGNATIASRTNVGSGFGLTIVSMGYALPSVALGAGTYYIGLQAVSSEFQVYLASASVFSGAVQSNNGGTTWTSGYGSSQLFTGVAVSLSGDAGGVPEPASWAMMIAGFGLVGAAMRRRALATA